MVTSKEPIKIPDMFLQTHQCKKPYTGKSIVPKTFSSHNPITFKPFCTIPSQSIDQSDYLIDEHSSSPYAVLSQEHSKYPISFP